MKLASLILPLYFQVGLSFPASTSKQLQRQKQGPEYNSLKQSWLADRRGVFGDILVQLSAEQKLPQNEKQGRSLAKLLDDIEVLTYSKKLEKLHRRKKSAGCTDFACTGDRATDPTTTVTTTTTPPPPNPATSSAATTTPATTTPTQTTTEATTASSESSSNNKSTNKSLQEMSAKLKEILEKLKFPFPTFPFPKFPTPTFPF